MRTDVKVGVVVSLFIVLIAGWYYMDGDSKEEPINLEGSTSNGAGDAVQPKSGLADKPATTSTDNNQRRMADARRSASTPRRTTPESNRTPANAVGHKPQHASRQAPQQESPSSDKVAHHRSRPSAIQAGTPNASAEENGSAHQVTKPSDASSGLASDNQPSQDDRRMPDAQTAAKTLDVDSTKGESKVEARERSKLENAQNRRDSRKPPSAVTGTPIHIGRQARATESMASPRGEATRPTSDVAAVDLHRVQLGDTFASLSRMYYGDEKYTQFLIEQNPAIADPSQLRVGTTIKIPALDSESDSREAEASVVTARVKSKPSGDQRSYTVKSGDTFYGIAGKALGNASRWREIYELNKSHVGGDPSRLKVGQVLILPNS